VDLVPILAYPTRSLARADRGVAGLATIDQPRALLAKPWLGVEHLEDQGSGVALGGPAYCTLASTSSGLLLLLAAGLRPRSRSVRAFQGQ